MKIYDNYITFFVDEIKITLHKQLLSKKFFKDMYNSIVEKYDATFTFKTNGIPTAVVTITDGKILVESGILSFQVVNVENFLRNIEEIINTSR